MKSCVSSVYDTQLFISFVPKNIPWYVYQSVRPDVPRSSVNVPLVSLSIPPYFQPFCRPSTRLSVRPSYVWPSVRPSVNPYFCIRQSLIRFQNKVLRTRRSYEIVQTYELRTNGRSDMGSCQDHWVHAKTTGFMPRPLGSEEV